MRVGPISLHTGRVCAALLALLAASSAHAGTDEARDWIQRMNKALATRNYDGVLVRQIGTRSVVLHIVHRVLDGRMNERVAVVSHDGTDPGWEFARNGSDWIIYDPVHHVAQVQTRNRSYGFLTALNGVNDDSARYYTITSGGAEHLEGRPTQRVSLEPRDELRYGYRFWLDAKTALPLKTQLVARSGEVVEEIRFVSISLPERIDDERLKPGFDTAHFRWMHGDVPMYTPGIRKVFVPRAELLPPGFRVRIFTDPAEEARAPGPRTRFIVTDGIAWVSVFVEQADPKDAKAARDANGAKDVKTGKNAADNSRAQTGTRADGVVVMGTSATYEALTDGFKITVVGEVPPSTVKLIAEAVRSE